MGRRPLVESDISLIFVVVHPTYPGTEVRTQSLREIVQINVGRTKTLREVFRLVCRKIGIPESKMVLGKNGCRIHDSVGNLQLTEVEIGTMGLRSGSTIYVG